MSSILIGVTTKLYVFTHTAFFLKKKHITTIITDVSFRGYHLRMPPNLRRSMKTARLIDRANIRGYGGLGRRAGFRFLWEYRAGSIPVIRTIKKSSQFFDCSFLV